jgi:hypothetical protein
MTIAPVVTVTEIKGGIAARAVEIGLAGHGRDRERAIASLRSMVRTWARCLLEDGELERTLARLGVATQEGGEGLDIDLDTDIVTN